VENFLLGLPSSEQQAAAEIQLELDLGESQSHN
jgi:hypothetical protein